jgi:cyclic pyranopterin phosphate synthase
MTDTYGRRIDYLRISVTDRCDLRCVYCMPAEGVQWQPHEKILRYEELLRLCRIFASLGVTKFKLTGGEPLVRKGIADLVAGIRAIDGVEAVTLTTNGVQLAEQLPALLAAGIDGINLSLDTLDRERFAAVTRKDALPQVLRGLDAALHVPGLNLKLNCVAMPGREEDWRSLAALAKDHPIAVRFIEPMPIGLGKGLAFCGEEEVRAALEKAYGPLTSFEGRLGNGPARYWTADGFAGKIGFISAVSHQFCEQCNRVRLTAAGYLKTCLQYDVGADLAPLLAGTDDQIRAAIADAIAKKPEAHRFTDTQVEHREQHIMSQIGG